VLQSSWSFRKPYTPSYCTHQEMPPHARPKLQSWKYQGASFKRTVSVLQAIRAEATPVRSAYAGSGLALHRLVANHGGQ
jgi:hypothetical protein